MGQLRSKVEKVFDSFLSISSRVFPINKALTRDDNKDFLDVSEMNHAVAKSPVEVQTLQKVSMSIICFCVKLNSAEIPSLHELDRLYFSEFYR